MHNFVGLKRVTDSAKRVHLAYFCYWHNW